MNETPEQLLRLFLKKAEEKPDFEELMRTADSAAMDYINILEKFSGSLSEKDLKSIINNIARDIEKQFFKRDQKHLVADVLRIEKRRAELTGSEINLLNVNSKLTKVIDRKKDYEEAREDMRLQRCAVCGTEIIHKRRWLLGIIPISPKYFARCPNCNCGCLI